MTYPKTRLNKKMRRLIMSALILAFFVISPLIIMYTAGFRYDWASRQIIQTGVISIDVEPKKASVYLNGVLIQKRLPIRLPNRAPGNYTVKIEALGYKTWEKEITVESRQTTYIKNITLFKDATPVQIYPSSDQIVDILFSASGEFALILRQAEEVYEVVLLDTLTKSYSTIIRTASQDIPKISWSPFFSHALVQSTDAENRVKFQIFDATNVTPTIYTHTVAEPATSGIQWSDASGAPSLSFQDGRLIYQIVGNRLITHENQVNSNVWYVDQNNNLWFFDPIQKVISVLNNKNDQLIPINEQIKDIIHTNNNRIIAKTDEKILVIETTAVSPNHKTLPVDQVIYNYGTNEWVAWSPWELWTIFPSGEIFLLNRTGEPMGNVLPLDKYGLLLFSDNNSLTGFNPGYFMSHKLLTTDNIKSLGADIKNKKIFFWGEYQSQPGIFELAY